MNDLFKGIHPSKQGFLLKMLEASSLHFSVNELVSSKIKMNNYIAIVKTGYLNIIKTDSAGNRSLVEVLDEGDVFGTNISNLVNSDYDVIAKEESLVIFIDTAYIYSNANINSSIFSQFLINLLEITQRKLVLNNERVDILTNKTIRNKLLSYFKYSYMDTNARIVYVPSSFTALADYLAIDRSAMSRELKNLKDEGLIEIKNKKIKLLYFPE
jgi:CRP-like cAMP-binding protein